MTVTEKVFAAKTMRRFVFAVVFAVVLIAISQVNFASGQLELEMPGFLRRFWDRLRYDDKGVILGQFITP